MMESWNIGMMGKKILTPLFHHSSIDDLVKSLFKRHPGASRGPEHLEMTGFRLPPE